MTERRKGVIIIVYVRDLWAVFRTLHFLLNLRVGPISQSAGHCQVFPV
jgi:hypothetical protein